MKSLNFMCYILSVIDFCNEHSEFETQLFSSKDLQSLFDCLKDITTWVFCFYSCLYSVPTCLILHGK